LTNKETYARVAIPLAVSGSFTYRIPQDLIRKLHAGQLVMVPFGSKKIYSALVLELTDNGNPDDKEILELLETFSPLPAKMMAFYQWMAEYYCATIGQVLTAALPARFRMNSETRIKYTATQLPEENMHHRELLLQLYHAEELSLEELIQLHGRHRTMAGIDEGIEAGLVKKRAFSSKIRSSGRRS
jgi:primosomal protein N' (replication factor Y)